MLVMNCTISKYGNRPDENEDAVLCYPSDVGYNQSKGIYCAMTDGATQSSFSQQWASLLVKLLVNKVKRYVPNKDTLLIVTLTAQSEWEKNIKKTDLPWHAQEKIKNGAFSTLLWLSIKKNKKNRKIKVIAVGDSNLIIVRDNKKLVAYPIENSQDFGNTPTLLCSRTNRNSQINDRVFDKVTLWEQDWHPGDHFLLATDALAQYMLRQFEKGENPSMFIAQLAKEGNLDKQQKEFENWIESLRKEKTIRNDDTTLVSIQMPPES